MEICKDGRWRNEMHDEEGKYTRAEAYIREGRIKG